MKRFIIKTSIFSIPLILLLVGVNYFGDAAKLYCSNKYEEKIVNILKDGKYVTNISNYNERIFQKKFIHSLDFTPSMVVLGSSRSRSINSEMLQESLLINNSVSGASMEDLIALFEIYKEVNRLPSKFIICIDPWMFNDNSEQTRWESISEYYYKFKNKPITSNNSWYLYRQLFSLSYFQSSLKTIFDKTQQPIATLDKVNSTNTMLSDGSNVQGLEILNTDKETVHSKVNSYLNKEYIYGLNNFNSISTDYLSDLYSLVEQLEKRVTEYSFFLSPYHPVVYNRIMSDYPLVLELEQILKKFSSNHGIKIQGSYDPGNLNMDESYFFDGMHCLEPGILKILEVKQ